jgi:hypothetical protein
MDAILYSFGMRVYVHASMFSNSLQINMTQRSGMKFLFRNVAIV